MNPKLGAAVGGLAVLAALAAPARAPAQESPSSVASGAAGLDRAAFPPLLADPKEPRFAATYLWADAPALSSRLAAVGLGQTIGVVRAGRWQLAVAAGVFSQFDMRSSKNDLMNTDYVVGVPVAYRRGALAARLRLYHQSSHLGDEYLLAHHLQRVDLTYEAAELLLARSGGRWRVYGGGEYLFLRSPRDLRPGVLHAGVEYRAGAPLLRLGRVAAGRVVAALDAKAVEDQAWRVGWSAVAGLELADPAAASGAGWRWRLFAQAYAGPAPFGEFYRERLSSLGVGVGVTR
jgi:hypothetical protein